MENLTNETRTREAVVCGFEKDLRKMVVCVVVFVLLYIYNFVM